MKRDWKKLGGALLLGILLGVSIGRWTAFRYHPWHGSSEKRFERLFNRFKRKLDLNQEQGVKVRNILKKKHQMRREIRDVMRPKIDEIRKQASLEIRELLNEDQIDAYDRMEAHWKKRREKRRHRH